MPQIVLKGSFTVPTHDLRKVRLKASKTRTEIVANLGSKIMKNSVFCKDHYHGQL